MKKMIHIRNIIIIVLSIAIICLSVGFMVLSIHLKKVSNQEHSFTVLFTKVEKVSAIKGSKKDPASIAKLSANGGRVEMKFSLNSALDEVSYLATIKNTGTIAAEIVDVMGSPDYNEDYYKKLIAPAEVSVTDFKGKIIPPDGEITVKITAHYNSSQVSSPKQFNYKLSFLAKSV